MTNTDRLGTIAAETAMKAAADYIIRVQPSFSDYDALTAALKARVPAALQTALDDAREALNAGMTQVSEATFLASMRMAGIEAAKAVART